MSSSKRMTTQNCGNWAMTTWSAGTYSGTAFAVQGKLGVDYLMHGPFDLYAEAVPSFGFGAGPGFGVGLAVGGRWYF